MTKAKIRTNTAPAILCQLLRVLLAVLLIFLSSINSTRVPTPAPTAYKYLNATIENGWCLDCEGFGQKNWIGTSSSDINNFISSYYYSNRYSLMVGDVLHKVWLNSTNGLSYLTLIGDYTADVPINMISQLILVLDGARLDAVPDFPVTAINPQSNNVGIGVTKWALVVFSGVYFSGIVSPGGQSKAVLSCDKLPKLPTSSTVVGPAGIFMYGSGAIIMDGITVDSCGMNNGNFVLYGTGRVEVANCVSANARTRGIWFETVIVYTFRDNHIINIEKLLLSRQEYY